jgi:hypothetical protein
MGEQMPYPETTIKTFITHFEQHIDAISSIGESSSYGKYKKILFLSVLDGISKPVFPDRPNRQRVTSLLERFSGWEDGERVSLPHLDRLLSRNPEPAYEELRSHVRNLLAGWPHGEHVHLESDPFPSEIIKHWPQEKQYRVPIEGISIESLQHWNLLYTYRNSLVHSLQVPGHGLDGLGFDEPFYIRVIMDESEYGPPAIYHLAYPEKHFELLCRNALKNVNEYLLANMIEPLQFIEGGSYFIAELN